MTEPAENDAERRELEALRSEVAALRSGSAPEATKRQRHTWRWIGCWLLVVVTAVLVLVAVVARFAESELLDTDRYVETVAPLA